MKIEDKIIKLLKSGMFSKADIIDETGVSRREFNQLKKDLKKKGINIAYNYDKQLYYLNTEGKSNKTIFDADNKDNWVRFGLISDTHLCSTEESLEYLHDFYQFLKSEGVNTVYHCGDVCDGMDVYPGHRNNLKEWGVDNQIDYIKTNYPQIGDLVTYFITGNHDLKIMKKSGIDIGVLLEQEREDLVYLGQNCRDIDLKDGCKMRLVHPAGGGSYAKSYKLQKYIESMRGGNKPNILAFGHFHGSLYMSYANVHGFMAGCFQDENDFTLTRGMAVTMGGWLVEAKIDDEGSLLEMKPWWKQYY